MKDTTVEYDSGFQLLMSNERAQAAEIVLNPGDSTGGPDNRHESSDQWLYVVSGEGKAVINKNEITLRPGKLILIERGDTHLIENRGIRPLKTINFYVPPAY